MTGAVFDFDNDGRQDVYIGAAEYAGNRALLYQQTAPRQFQALDPADFFEHYRAHGVAVADFDRDGDLDVLVGHSRFRCDGFEGTECMPTNQVQLYENLVGQDQRWLQLKLIGHQGVNHSAIGARVTVSANGQSQTQVVDGGHGRFGLQRDLTLHFGLADASSGASPSFWPDAERSEHIYHHRIGSTADSTWPGDLCDWSADGACRTQFTFSSLIRRLVRGIAHIREGY